MSIKASQSLKTRRRKKGKGTSPFKIIRTRLNKVKTYKTEDGNTKTETYNYDSRKVVLNSSGNNKIKYTYKGSG